MQGNKIGGIAQTFRNICV